MSRKAFRNPLTVREIFNHHARQPAHAFAAATGVTGIAGDYRFPDDMTASMVQDLYIWRFGDPMTVPLIVKRDGLHDVRFAGMASQDRPRPFFNHVSGAYKYRVEKFWAEMVDINPALQWVAPDKNTFSEIYDAAYGAISGFNPVDIKFFQAWERQGKLPAMAAQQEVVGLAARREKIMRATGVHIGWVAAPRTLDRICAALNI